MIQPFKGQLDKGVILQETRMFSETPLRTRECYNLLTKILYFLSKGEQLTTKEATDLFFAVTKLFQSNDVLIEFCLFCFSSLFDSFLFCHDPVLS